MRDERFTYQVAGEDEGFILKQDGKDIGVGVDTDSETWAELICKALNATNASESTDNAELIERINKQLEMLVDIFEDQGANESTRELYSVLEDSITALSRSTESKVPEGSEKAENEKALDDTPRS